MTVRSLHADNAVVCCFNVQTRVSMSFIVSSCVGSACRLTESLALFARVQYNEKVYDLLNNKKLLDVVRLAKETIVKV